MNNQILNNKIYLKTKKLNNLILKILNLYLKFLKILKTKLKIPNLYKIIKKVILAIQISKILHHPQIYYNLIIINKIINKIIRQKTIKMNKVIYKQTIFQI